MKKVKRLLVVILTFCMLCTMSAAPVTVSAEESVVKVWKSSDYLNPDSPVTENNPWSIETTNTLDGAWEAVIGTTPSVTDPAFDLFPVMPDGVQPHTAYVHTGKSTSPGWTVNVYNTAVNGKYMMPGAFYEASKNYRWCSSTQKVAKVFTVPESGTIKITAAATNGEGTEGLIAAGKMESWDREAQAFIVTQNENEIWKKTGNELFSSNALSADNCNYIEFEAQQIEVTAGDKLYFTFDACNWADRQTQTVMWDPVVEYSSGDEEPEEPELPEVDDTDRFVSSKYLDPGKPYKNNPWSVESTNNPNKTWETVTNTVPTANTTFELFPVMPDGNQPATGYIQTGDYVNDWGVQGVNMAVSGKYMIGGAVWTTDDTTAGSTIAKVFTAPKNGWIKVTAAATIDEETEGLIIPNKVTDAQYSDSMLSWMLQKNDSILWSANGTKREVGIKYDYIEFPETKILVNAGDKIRFAFKPRTYAVPRSEQACMWDPVVEYTSYDVGGEDDEPEEDDPNSFLSSRYLDPENPIEESPWSVESTNNTAEIWKPVTNTLPASGATFPLFPMMSDGKQPLTGYVQTGDDCSTYWSKQGFNMAVNGKYMVPAAFWTNDTKTASAKIAKVFTAPKDGMITVAAAAVMGVGSEGLIIPNKVSVDWYSGEDLAWIVEKNGVQIWKRDGTQRVVGDNYDMVQFDTMLIEIKEGDKLYFILQPKSYAERAEMACIWDPKITYIGEPIVLSDESRDKPDATYPLDHKFELTLTGTPLEKISAEDIVLSGGKGNVVNVYHEGNILKFEISGLEKVTDYELCIKNIAYAFAEDEMYGQDLIFNFSTADVLSLVSDIAAADGLKTGNNTLTTSVICSDDAKIANGDTVIMIVAVMNGDDTVSKVLLDETELTQRITGLECDVNIADGQWIRCWVVESLNNIKPLNGNITDIIR